MFGLRGGGRTLFPLNLTVENEWPRSIDVLFILLQLSEIEVSQVRMDPCSTTMVFTSNGAVYCGALLLLQLCRSGISDLGRREALLDVLNPVLRLRWLGYLASIYS